MKTKIKIWSTWCLLCNGSIIGSCKTPEKHQINLRTKQGRDLNPEALPYKRLQDERGNILWCSGTLPKILWEAGYNPVLHH